MTNPIVRSSQGDGVRFTESFVASNADSVESWTAGREDRFPRGERKYCPGNQTMFTRSQDFQIAAFFLLVLVFELLERSRPARELDRWRFLKVDVLSFAFAILANRLSHYTVGTLVRPYAPDFMVSSLAWLHTWPSVLRIAVAIVIVDFIIYWLHRGQHRFNALWRTHAWHHSVEHLYWFSGFRTSFLHSFLYAIPAASVPILIFGLTPIEAGIGYSIGLLIQFWEHTNLRINLGPLEKIIVTPQYHRVHHSATRHQGMNLGTTFSLWDRMFGTYVDPATVPADVPLGLGEPIDERRIPRMMLGV